jgi:hypothetical protein
MNKIISLLVFLVSFSVYSQDINLNINGNYLTNTYGSSVGVQYTPRVNVNVDLSQGYRIRSSYGEPSFPTGPAFMLGGAAMALAGFLTVPDYYMTPSGEIVTKPFFRQGARMLSIMTGAVLVTVGVVITISGR